MADEYRKYKTNVKNYTGYEHQKYKSQLMQVAFTKPSDYYKLQTDVMGKILEANIDQIYSTVFHVLKSGRKGNANVTEGGAIINRGEYPDTLDTMGIDWNPSVPEQEADRIAKMIVDGFQSDIEKHVIDLVLPKSIFNDALKRSAKKAEAGISDS
jgi:hypothetical protein